MGTRLILAGLLVLLIIAALILWKRRWMATGVRIKVLYLPRSLTMPRSIRIPANQSPFSLIATPIPAGARFAGVPAWSVDQPDPPVLQLTPDPATGICAAAPTGAAGTATVKVVCDPGFGQPPVEDTITIDTFVVATGVRIDTDPPNVGG